MSYISLDRVTEIVSIVQHSEHTFFLKYFFFHDIFLWLEVTFIIYGEGHSHFSENMIGPTVQDELSICFVYLSRGEGMQ